MKTISIASTVVEDEFTERDVKSMELVEIHRTTSNNSAFFRASTTIKPFPLADRGREAYLLLAACFVVELVLWGLPGAYGTFLQYYEDNGVGKEGSTSDASLLPLVGSFSSGLMYLFGPPVTYLLNPRPRWRIPAIWIGSIIAVLALLLSSFATTPWQLLLTQGFLYSIGGSLASYPAVALISEWFVIRHAMANAIMFCGTSCGGLIYPFVLNALLERYKGALTLQILAGSTAVFLVASIPFLKPRLPQLHASELASQREHAGPSSKWWENKRLNLFQLANFFQSFGFFIPMLYLPLYATSLGLSPAFGSSLLSIVNGSSLFSRIGIGMLGSRVSPYSIAFWSLVTSTLAVGLIWGVASTSTAPLLVFALVLGIFSGGWTSIYPIISREEDPAVSATVFAVACCIRGIGSLITAPVSTLLLDHPLVGASSKVGYGINNGSYGSLLLFATLMLLLATGIQGIATIKK